jgi:hypothetical protein
MKENLNSNAWSAIHAAIRHRFLRCVLTYRSRLRALLETGGASRRASHSIRHCLQQLNEAAQQ